MSTGFWRSPEPVAIEAPERCLSTGAAETDGPIVKPIATAARRARTQVCVFSSMGDG
jgi:hypothetical protein